ncbi:MAG TPA: helix-turn-helix domain-containing protein [Polyangiaceae bacterium]|jgi:AcrR family transcriptional regulator|nr:helix-turn-helix domain-containing protein [Polyangiaceae bacterium]
MKAQAKAPEADRTGLRRLSPEQRRAQIIDVTEQLFTTRAYADIGVPDVAEAAGVTPGLVYHYFASKEALFLATYELRAKELLRFCQPDPTLPFEEQVLRGVRGYLDFVEAHGRAYLNLFHSAAVAEAQFVALCESTREILVDNFVIALGSPDPSRAPALRLSLRGYLGYSESVVLSWLERRQVSRATLERFLLAAILSAIRIGLASEADALLSPADAATLEREYRKRFGLP